MTNEVAAAPAMNANDSATNAGAAASAAPGRAEDFEPTKPWLRTQVWTKMLEKNCSTGVLMYCVPAFVGSDKAATLLSETDEFQKAQTVEVHFDHVLQIVKLKVLLASKALYLSGTRESRTVLLLRVDVPEIDSDGSTAQSLHLHQVVFESKVKLDMVVIGSVVVSRDGYRIGDGKTSVDLEIGLLVELGCITPDTIIATIVHDEQVVDRLPTNVFQKYDAPVDLIVTPTEVIRVTPRLPHPSGIFWELLSARRLRLMPVLQTLKERVEQIACDNGGHANIVLLNKEERPNGDFIRRRRFRHRQSNGDVAASAQQNAGAAADAKKKEQKRRFWRFFNRNRQSAKAQKSSNEVNKSMDQSKLSSGDGKAKSLLKRVGSDAVRPEVHFRMPKVTRELDSLFMLWKGKCNL